MKALDQLSVRLSFLEQGLRKNKFGSGPALVLFVTGRGP